MIYLVLLYRPGQSIYRKPLFETDYVAKFGSCALNGVSIISEECPLELRGLVNSVDLP